MLLIEVFANAGVIERFDPPHYAPDHMMHSRIEVMLPIVLRFAHEVAEPKPGDVVLYKVGRIYAHAAIVIAWPSIIHANKPARAVVPGLGTEGRLAACPRKFFSRW